MSKLSYDTIEKMIEHFKDTSIAPVEYWDGRSDYLTEIDSVIKDFNDNQKRIYFDTLNRSKKLVYRNGRYEFL